MYKQLGVSHWSHWRKTGTELVSSECERQATVELDEGKAFVTAAAMNTISECDSDYSFPAQDEACRLYDGREAILQQGFART